MRAVFGSFRPEPLWAIIATNIIFNLLKKKKKDLLEKSKNNIDGRESVS